MEYKNYYDTLGVSKNADKDEIKKAYRKLARQYHPDMKSGDKAAEEKFKEVNEAFTQWLEKYNFSHEHEGINKQCPADLYTPSLRKLSRDELEFILVHEEPRRVRRSAAITYYAH